MIGWIQSKGNRFFGWMLLMVLALIWGSSFILIKKGLQVYDPGEVAGIRILAASIFLLPWAFANLKKVNKWNLKYLFFIGIAGSFIPAFLFAKAQTKIDSSLAGVLNATTPFFVLMIGAIFFGQLIYRRQSLGLTIGFLGTVVLVMAGSRGLVENINLYGLFVVLATFFYGINVNIIKYKLVGLRALTITSISLLIVLPFAAAYLFGFTDFMYKLNNADEALFSLGLVVLLGVMGTAIALVLFNKLVQITTPIFTSSVTYLIPVVAVLWGFLDGEMLLFAHYSGMAIIFVGVFITNHK